MCWRQSPLLYDEVGLLRDVHGPLRAKILQHVGAKIRPQLPILQACTRPASVVSRSLRGDESDAAGSCTASGRN
jgi:hypothetical protein